MIDATTSLRSFGTWARATLNRDINAQIAALLGPASLGQAASVKALSEAVAAAGGGVVGRAAVADQVAYTWFHRIVALRFMDANGFTRAGVVSAPAGRASPQPQILVDAQRGVFDPEVVRPEDCQAVSALLRRADEATQDQAYGLLLADYCRHWALVMPTMFGSEDGFTDLLMPAHLLARDSVLARSVDVLSEQVCRDVEVVGWLHQFYLSERKAEVYEGFRRTKAGAAEIPVATQVFTPDWIVRFLVENSLGRLWLLNRPESRLADQMNHYIAPVEGDVGFLKIAGPEDLRVIDPACGAGHLLTYAFDLLHAIYEEEGYALADIPRLILTNNLHGAEIDPRAAALATFALTMKARGRQQAHFGDLIEPHVCVVRPIEFTEAELVAISAAGLDDVVDPALWADWEHASMLGSLIRPSLAGHGVDLARAEAVIDRDEGLLDGLVDRVRAVLRQAQILGRNHHVVVANPPYLGTRHMGAALRALAAREYPRTKGDLCTMFVERSLELLMDGGLAALVTSESWFFNSTFEATRNLVRDASQLRVAACIDSSAFAVVLNTVATVIEKAGDPAPATFFRVDRAAIRSGGTTTLPVDGSPVHVLSTEVFDQVPGRVFAFDMPEALLALYSAGPTLGQEFLTRQGMATTDNARFVRFWWEVSPAGIDREHVAGSASNPDWVPYNKGGTPTRWWGNQLHVVRWKDGAAELRHVGAKSVREANFFRTSVSWSNIGSGGAQFRHYPAGFVFDVAGMSVFADDEAAQLNLMGYLNSGIVRRGLDVLAPTLNYQVGDVARLPIPDVAGGDDAGRVGQLVALSRELWAHDELAHGFTGNPLTARGPGSLSVIVKEYQSWRADHAALIRDLEQRSDAYWREVIAATSGVLSATKDLPADVAPPPTAAALVRDLVSFAVGCMFGRFHLPGCDVEPAAANVIPVLGDCRFDDDLLTRFRQFLCVALGEQHGEANERFVAESLGVRSLRDYFATSFYRDHVQRYRKRPIYWLFSSPRGSFRALAYVHRYTPSTLSAVTDYVRELADLLDEGSGSTKDADRVRATLLELREYEHMLEVLAAKAPVLDLDLGIRVNHLRLGSALAAIPGPRSRS